jgi:hypothetical protein
VIPVGVLLGDRETACLTNTCEYGIDEFCTTGASALGQPSFIIALLVSIMKFKLVSEKTGQPIGFGKSIVGQLAHIIDGAICLPS